MLNDIFLPNWNKFLTPGRVGHVLMTPGIPERERISLCASDWLTQGQTGSVVLLGCLATLVQQGPVEAVDGFSL